MEIHQYWVSEVVFGGLRLGLASIEAVGNCLDVGVSVSKRDAYHLTVIKGPGIHRERPHNTLYMKRHLFAACGEV